MAQVSIVMGSDSDMPVMAKAAEILDKFGISYEMRIISAHRMPDTFFEYAQTAEERGVKVIIAGAGSSAGYVRCIVSDAGDRYPDAHDVSGRQGFPVFHRSDALRYPGGDRCDQRRCKRRYSGGEDFSGFRSGASCKAQGLQRRDERRRTEKGCKAAGMRLSQLHKINRCTGTVWRIRWITRVLEWILKPDTNRWN